MTEAANLVLLTLLQLFTGIGVLALCRVRTGAGIMVPTAALTGIAVCSILPFLLQLLSIPLTSTNVFSSILFASLLLNLRWRQSALFIKEMIKAPLPHIRLYHLPVLLPILFFVFISVWRCFYLPPTPRDLTSGAEVIAEYAVREKTMINSVFSVNLESTNNQFKPPFITSLQIIYKYAGFPFGQIWLSKIFVCFLLVLYAAMKKRVHSLVAGLLILFFIAIPEMYAYSYIALFDYSNAVYFFLSLFFLFRFFSDGRINNVLFSGLMMGVATYVRSETLILAGLILPAIWWQQRTTNARHSLLTASALFFTPAVLLYLLSVTVYLQWYLPVPYEVEGLVNKDLFNLELLLNRFLNMNGKLIFSAYGVELYGYFIFLFLLVIIFDFTWARGFNSESGWWFFSVLVVYLGYPLLGYLLPLLDIDHSTKRGLFKMFPLMLLYMASCSVCVKLSQWLNDWEAGAPQKTS